MAMDSMRYEKPRWAAKVRPEWIARLYESEASGRLDDELLDRVGLALLLRVESTLHYGRNQVRCPVCRSVFVVVDDPVTCPGPDCRWQTTRAIYYSGRRHRDLNVCNAAEAFESFASAYPSARSPADRMRLIDRLIHEFHWDGKFGVPNRSVGNNLIEGRHEDVVAFLDALSANGRDAEKANWRLVVARMRERRGTGAQSETPDSPSNGRMRR
jgi:hypothetical protein